MFKWIFRRVMFDWETTYFLSSLKVVQYLKLIGYKGKQSS